MKPVSFFAVFSVCAALGGCSAYTNTVQLDPEVGHTVATVQQLQALGVRLSRSFNSDQQNPVAVLVAPAVTHDGQLRSSQYGEAIATQITAGLIQGGLQVVEGTQSGWTSGKPVVVVATERAARANASVVALGSYQHIGNTEVVAYRLVDIQTGRLLSFAEMRFVRGAQ